MFWESLCRSDDSAMPDDIFIRTELYDALRNIFNEIGKVTRTPGYAFAISYGPKISGIA